MWVRVISSKASVLQWLLITLPPSPLPQNISDGVKLIEDFVCEALELYRKQQATRIDHSRYLYVGPNPYLVIVLHTILNPYAAVPLE